MTHAATEENEMEMILINANKLKVILTPDDMERYALTCEMIDYDNTETRRAFWDIFDTAKHRTGFDAASARIYVQAYPSRGGGCELYVTRMVHKHAERVPTVSLHVKSMPVLDDGEYICVFRFDTLNDLLNACEKLHDTGYSHPSSAYADRDTQKYYLLLPLFEDEVGFSFLEEYGHRMTEQVIRSYISEHCICLTRDAAVDLLAALA